MSTSETLALLKAALTESATGGDLAKTLSFPQSTSATTGLTDYDLEAAAKTLYPVPTPLRNLLPRVSGKGGIQANWKAVTGLNTTIQGVGLPEARRGGVFTGPTADYFAAYRTIGQEGTVSDEQVLASGSFDDARARTAMMTLQNLMIKEEGLILGGNTGWPLGAPPAGPTLTTSTSGGSLSGTTAVSVIVVPLTYHGYLYAALATGVAQTISTVAADGMGAIVTNGGVGVKSANATVTTGAGSSNSVTASITALRGAFGYAWYWGAAGSEVLGAITRVSQVVIAATATGTQTAASLGTTDYSSDGLIFDGLLTMASANQVKNLNSYYYAATPGAGLTADNVGGIVEIDTLLQDRYDNYLLGPSHMIISSQEMNLIRRKVLTGANASNARFVFNTVQGQIVGGGIPKAYINPFATGNAPQEIPIMVHPNMPKGTILFITDSLPYPMNNIDNVLCIRARKDYYQTEWPRRMRQHEFGVYSDQVLQNYFPPGSCVLTNLSAV